MTTTTRKEAYREAFNLLCGDKIGEGVYRMVFECTVDPTLVVKVEKDYGTFNNAREWAHWDECQYWEKGNRWLAPCVSISPNGLVLLQKRCKPVPEDMWPKKIPSFLKMDHGRKNFGLYEGRIVCHDYPQLGTIMPLTMVNANFQEGT